MSNYQDSRRHPSYRRPVDAYADSQSSTPRASWQSRASAPTWMYTPQQYPKAPPLEPVLTTAPATNMLGNTELPSLSEEEEQMTIDADGPDRESILGSRRMGSPSSSKRTERRKNFVGGFVNGLKMLPKAVIKGVGLGRKTPLRLNTVDTDNTGGSNATGGTALPSYEAEPPPGTSSIEYVDAIEMPVEEPAPVRRPSPASAVSVRNHDTRTYDAHMYNPHPHDTHHYDIHNYDNQNYDPHIYHPPDIHTQIHYPQEGETSTVHQEMVYNPVPSVVYQGRHHAIETPAAHYDDVDHGAGFDASFAHPSLSEQVPAFVPPSDSAQTESSIKTPPTSPHPHFGIQRFFKSLYRLPWVSSRITSDYEPRGRGDQPSQTKPASSWYFRRRYSLDLLSSGESLPIIPDNTNDRRHRGERVQTLSTTSSSSPQITPLNHRRKHRHQRNNTSDVIPLSHSSPAAHRNRRAGHHTQDSSPTGAPTRGRQRGHTGNASISSANGSSTSSRERRHRHRTASDIDPHSPPRSHKFTTFPQGYAPYPYAPPQPLFIVTPPSPSWSGGGGPAEMRQAVPLYMLAPSPPTMVTTPQIPVPMPAVVASPKPSVHPVPISPNRSHHSQTA